MLPLPLVALVVASDPAQLVRLEVAVDCPGQTVKVEAEAQWLGEARLLKLADDGSVPGDRPRDGVHSGVWTGDAVRTLPLQLFATVGDGARTEVVAAPEHIALGTDRLVWALDCSPALRARRVALALPGRMVDMAESTGLAATLGWFGLVLTYVAWLAQPRRPVAGGGP